MEPDTKSVIGSTTYQLLRQSVDQKPEIFPVDSDKLFETAIVPNSFRAFGSKNLNVLAGKSIQVAIAYPTEKEEKIAPLRKTIESYIKQQKEKRSISINIEEFFFQIKDTGVGEQPLHPQGLVGALERIYYIQDSLLGKRDWEQRKFKQPDVQEFDRIIIPSLESDLRASTKGIYDKPNVIFYECFTGHFVAGMGTGPYVEKDIFELSQRLGDVLFDDSKAVTYGKTLMAVFPQPKMNHANWHGVVCHDDPITKAKCDRVYFIKQLCEALGEQLTEFFAKVFHP
jgi:hypothetical protein